MSTYSQVTLDVVPTTQDVIIFATSRELTPIVLAASQPKELFIAASLEKAAIRVEPNDAAPNRNPKIILRYLTCDRATKHYIQGKADSFAWKESHPMVMLGR